MSNRDDFVLALLWVAVVVLALTVTSLVDEVAELRSDVSRVKRSVEPVKWPEPPPVRVILVSEKED